MDIHIKLTIDDRFVNFFKNLFRGKNAVKWLMVFLVLCTISLSGSEITKPYHFVENTEINPDEVNANFDDLFAKVNELDGRSWDKSGNDLVYNKGNIEIGTTNPGVESGILFSDDASGRGQLVYNHSTDAMSFVTAGSTRQYISSNGNVGIGTTNPLSLLSVGADGIAGIAMYGYSSRTAVYGESNVGFGMYGNSGSGIGVAGRSGSGIGASGGSDSSYGVYGDSFSGIGVYGRSRSSTGVYGRSSSSTGVYGRSDSSIGVYGRSDSSYSYDFYAAGFGVNYGPFTGGHEVILSDDFAEDVKTGMIVSSTGETKIRRENEGKISISSTLPTVRLSNKINDKAVFGVFVAENSLPKDHWYEAKEGDRFATANALGEGRVLVTNINGDIQNGDYITTSSIPGYGQKQNDDILHSYTLGKVIESVDWDKIRETINLNGVEYKVYLIAVVYVSG